MTLSQGIIYYLFAFVLTLGFIICGCFIGITLRKRKDAKAESVAAVDDESKGNSNDLKEK